MKKRHIGWMLVLACVFLSSCFPGQTEKKITIASKQFTENVLLSEMYALLIEDRTDLEVVLQTEMGTTAVCFAAIERGEIDLYVEYTGTVYKEILRLQDSVSPDERYSRIAEEMNRQYNIKVYPTIGLNNTYALAMLRRKAEAYGIYTMSDLGAAAPKLVFSANELFYTRTNDGYDAMVQTYNMTFKSVVRMDSTAAYSAVGKDQADVMVVYATDSLLHQYDMVILEDDLELFPDYYAVPMLRNELLEQYPELDSAVSLLADRIDNECMQDLNYLVDIEGKTTAEVASAFLAEQGLLSDTP